MLIQDTTPDWIKAFASERGGWANIPPKLNRKDPICFICTGRAICVERFFNKLKHFRAVATRYDKRADNFLAGIKLASARIWMRFNESMA